MNKKYHGHPKFFELVKEIKELYSKKNIDYSGKRDPLSNFKICEKFGIPAWKGVIVRISDKFSRITRLASGKKRKVKDETMIDSLKDLAVYALICVILYEERKK